MTEDRAINADVDGRRRTPPNAQPIIMAFIVCLHYNNHHQPSRQTVSFAPSPLLSMPHRSKRWSSVDGGWWPATETNWATHKRAEWDQEEKKQPRQACSSSPRVIDEFHCAIKRFCLASGWWGFWSTYLFFCGLSFNASSIKSNPQDIIDQPTNLFFRGNRGGNHTAIPLQKRRWVWTFVAWTAI